MVKSVISIINAVLVDFRAFFWPRQHGKKLLRLGGALLIIVLIVRLTLPATPEETSTITSRPPAVSLVSAREVADESTPSYLGTVRARSEAQLVAEVGGRVTSVRVRAGEPVAAGSIIATLENSAQRASVLQAEGAYEQAVAAAAQRAVGVTQAQTNLATARDAAKATYAQGYATTNSQVVTVLDQFFANPQSAIVGSRLATRDTQQHNQRRKELQTRLASWQRSSSLPLATSTIATKISEEIATVELATAIADEIIRALEAREDSDTFYGVPVSTLLNNVLVSRNTLISTSQSMRAAVSQVRSAEEAVMQAQIAATGGTVSAAEAQVKSALGRLRAAQSQLAKTTIRSPIAGVVTTLNVDTGDYIPALTQVAEIASDGGFEVEFFVTDTEAAQLSVVQSVRAGSATGTIVSIAAGVDELSQKVAVRAAVVTDSLVGGSTVPVTLAGAPVAQNSATASTPTLIRLPLTAVRFAATDGYVYTVSETQELVRMPVELGPVRGELITITNGIDADTPVVADARGLNEGQTVVVQGN